MINGRKHQTLLDTGCEISIVPADMVFKCNIHESNQKVLAVNGTEISILDRTILQAKLGDQDIEIDGVVSEHVGDVMVGIDWLQTNGVVWDFAKGEIVFNGRRFPLSPSRRGGSQWCRRVVLAEDQVIPPRSKLDITTKVVYNSLRPLRSDEVEAWATESREIEPGIMVARTMLPDRAENVPVRILNTTASPVEIQKGKPISNLERLSPLVPHQSAMKRTHKDDELIEEMVSQVDPSVPRHIQDQLRDILYNYSSVFSKNEWDLGWTELVSHEIDVGDHKPIRQTMRRYPYSHLQAIDKHLDDMLKQGVIEPACSPWASNVVLAKKKDGTLRCCIDFRQLNDITKKDAYPLPRTDTCLDAMSGSCLFSTFDLRSSYHQLPMHPESTDKTTFITHRGAYRFRTMPFGLCNAGATFQRLMDLVLTGLNFEICLVYLDDIVLFSTTPEEHLGRLTQVLERLKQANLKLKPSKCRLMQKQVEFLGHVISGDGIATDPEKTRLVEEWPEPTNIKQLRGYLGLTGYYRRFVRDYAKIAAPLHRLTRKDQPFVWTDDCQAAFEELKKRLISPPILAMPNDEGPFVLDCDACDTSIGAVLSQVQRGQERVIAYAGRILNRSELNYCVARKELLAVVFFVQHFRQYLLGRTFTIRTDHSALSWLKKTPEPIGQNARWLEVLGEYSFIIKHRPGSQHGNADALSRHPCLNRPSCTACHPTRVNSVELTRRQQEALSPVPSSKNDEPSDPLAGRTDHLLNNDDTADQPVDVPTTANKEQTVGVNVTETDVQINWTNIEVMIEQVQDLDIGFIRQLMVTCKEKPSWKAVETQSAEVKSLWSEWDRLSL